MEKLHIQSIEKIVLVDFSIYVFFLNSIKIVYFYRWDLAGDPLESHIQYKCISNLDACISNSFQQELL